MLRPLINTHQAGDSLFRFLFRRAVKEGFIQDKPSQFLCPVVCREGPVEEGGLCMDR